MVQILFRTLCFVKFLCLLTLTAYAEVAPASSERVYRVELLAYQQPEGAAFGNVQPSKYTHLVDDTPLGEIDSDRAYVDAKHAPAFQTLAQRLQRDGIANRLFSWVVKLQPQESLTLPVDATISLASGDSAATAVDGFSLRGQLAVSRNQYVDITCQQTIHMLRGGQTYQFDYTEHSRHLKLDKTHYLDNEHIGMLIKVTAAEFSPPPPVQPVEDDSTADSSPDADDTGSTVASDLGDHDQAQAASTGDITQTPQASLEGNIRSTQPDVSPVINEAPAESQVSTDATTQPVVTADDNNPSEETSNTS